MKLGREGNYCLSQEGAAAGVEDAATHSAITASSSADAAAHGANMAVDGRSSAFWVRAHAFIFLLFRVCACKGSLLALQASALDPAEPVTVTVDLGGQKKLNGIDVGWEFPAKSFSVGVSTDGVKWSEVFATDSNVLSSSSIALGSVSASKVRVVMHEARRFAS